MEDWGLVEEEIEVRSGVKLFASSSLNYDVEVRSVDGDLRVVSG